MPINYSLYPKNWKTEIRPAILKRDNNCCKQCKAANGDYGYRDREGNFYSAEQVHGMLEATGYDIFDKGNELDNCWTKDGEPTKPIQIVLTIAHLDHDIQNNHYNNLAALCQRCHLHIDKEQHAANSRTTRNNKKGLQNLF